MPLNLVPDPDNETGPQLEASQQFAQQRSPDQAAKTFSYAKEAGLDFESAERVKPQPQPQADWPALTKEHPALAKYLTDPGRAAIAHDDVHHLSLIEELYKGWDEVGWASKLALEDDARNQELSAIGRAQRYGKATPAQLARAAELEKQAAQPKPEMGFVPGIAPAMVGMLPGLKRAGNVAGGYALAGAGGGALVGAAAGGVGAVPGAAAGFLTMGGAGFVVGMAQDTALTEQGLAYREFSRAPGVTHDAAAVAADIVALANGGLQAIPAEKVLNLVPGLKGLIAGKATRDIMRKIIGSNTGQAALARFAGRVAQSGLLMALVGGGQELVREVGAIGSGADDSLHGTKILEGMRGGAQQGLGFGVAHAALPLRGDLREAQLGQARGEMYKAIGGIASESKLRERMPNEFKAYVNSVIAEHGKVNEVKAPAEALSQLLQKEGITGEQVQETMPEVAKQLREAKPTDEVVIPMGDLATHLAPLKGFTELAQDLRVADELTPREAKKVQAEVEKNLAKEPEAAKEGAPAPERQVYEDVYQKLTAAGQAPEVAQHQASLWAAMSKARGERLGVDPFEYYKQKNVNIGAELPSGDVTLGQINPEHPAFKKWFGESKIVDEEGKPRVVYHGTTHVFDSFSNERGNPESHYGRAHYFTSEPADASGNYGGKGPDLTSRIEQRAEAIFGEHEGNWQLKYGTQEYEDAMHAARTQAEKELAGDAPSVMPVHLRMENPVVIEPHGGTYLSGDELNGKRVIKALQKVGEKYGIDLSELSMHVWDGTNAYDFEQEMRKFEPIIYAEDSEGRLISNEIIRDVWQASKFDGIDMNADAAFGQARSAGKPMEGIDENTRHYIAFKPNQIKSIFNRGTFSRRSDNIMYQPAYHGSPYKFDKFTLDHIGAGEGAQVYGWGLYFAEEKQVAEFYKETLGQHMKVGADELKAEVLARLDKKIEELDAAGKGSDRARTDADWLESWSEGKVETHLDDVQSIADRHEIDISDLYNPEDKGKLYEVNVPDKEELLDYDAPIAEQPPAVLEKLKKAGLLREGTKDPIALLREFLTTDFAKSFSDSSEVRVVKRLLKDGDVEEIKQWIEQKKKDPSAAITNNVLKDNGGLLYDRLTRELGSQRAASEALKEAGIPGLKYLDQGSRGTEGGTHNFVIWNEDAISALNILEQRGGAAGSEGYRGKITFDQARSFFNITLTGRANLSTFLHESGHAFLEFLRKDAEAGHEQSKADFAKLQEWMGGGDTEHLEKFARGFEAYLMEGKAPAAGLREQFRAFASWLKLVYRSIKGLGVNLTDEVRGVMDRMLASDGEIEQARQNLGFEPMKKPEGMSDAEYTSYKERFGRAVEKSREMLESQAVREFGKTIGDEREKIRAEVEASLKLDPAQNAYEGLRAGKRLDGGEIAEEVRGKKLSREAIREYPGYKDTARWTSISDPNGLDPEILAPYYGFKNGQEMLDALAARRPFLSEAKDITDQRMRDKYPDAEMAKMADQAVKSFHTTNEVADVLWTEAQTTAKYLKGLEAQAMEGKASLKYAKEVIRETARRRVEAMTGIEMQPGKYARAEERAAQESAAAFKKGDFEKAHEEKLNQIMNHELWKRVSDAKEEVDSIRDYLAKFDELPTRRRIGKAGQMYVEAIDKIVADIELKRQTNKELSRRASLESYLKQMEEEDGATITIPDELRAEASLKNYKQMTLEELRTVHDAVRNIESMARLKNRLFDGRENRNYHETAVKASQEIRANLGNPYAEKPGSAQNPGWYEKKKIAFRESRAEKKMIEFVARELDGGKTAGFLHELIFQPFATAEGKKHEMTKAITEELMKPLREMTLKERFSLDKTVDFLGTPMKMRDVIAVALNVGNEGNKKKLLDGYGYRGWTEEGVIKRLGELLTPKHLDLVQHFWSTINKLWPEIKALSERTTGLPPPKVEASKITIGGRELEGGYYPIVYDRARTYKAEQIAQRKGDLFENNFLKPGVSKGFTEARTKFAAPLLLSLNVIPSHINEVIHYLTHYEPTRAVDRLLSHGEMRSAITEGLGREVYNLFRPWLQRIAHAGSLGLEHETTIDKTLRYLRVGNTLNRFGFKITSSLMQGFNLLSSIKELGGTIEGTKYLGLGVKRWMEDVESFRDPFGPVYEHSKELAGKAQRVERELLGNFDRFTSAFSEFGHMKEVFGHFAMSFFTHVIRTADTITWYAAREKAFADEHPRPHEYADSIVRMAQMGEGVKDKAAIMFGGEGTKLFTGMYSWYSVVYNQLFEKMPQNATTAHKVAEYASRWWWMVIAPTVAMGMLKGKGPKKDQDEATSWAQYYGEEIALEATKPFPLLGVAAETALTEHDARWGVWIPTMIKGIKARAKLVRGEPLSEHEKADIVKSTGILGRLPADAMWNAYKYVSAVSDGKLEEPIRDLLFRSPGEWK